MSTVDTRELAEIVNQCFDNSTDGRFTPEQRAAFLEQGRLLRAQLMKLLGAKFAEGTPEVATAVAALKAVNADLKASATSLAQTAATLNNVARLVGTLDKLLGVAGSFV